MPNAGASHGRKAMSDEDLFRGLGQSWVIDGEGNLYCFGLVGGTWRFTSYMNINE
jgi:sugar lactone lactonase YvrE